METKTLILEHKKRNWITKIEDDYTLTRNELIKKIKEKQIGKSKTINVAGFNIETKEEIETEHIVNDYIQEKNKEEQFRNELKAKGVNPIAVLPKNIFQKMIKDFPFYTFRNINEKGEVKGRLENTEINMGENTTNFLLNGNLIVWATLGFLISPFFYIPLLFLTLTMIFFVIPKEDLDNLNDREERIFSIFNWISFPIYLSIETIRNKGDMRKRLWPNKIDEGNDYIKLILPDPPKSVAMKLLKCHENNIKTYLVIHEKGFGIDAKEVKKKFRKEYDPIICSDSEYGNFVAIIDQFGDIPEEKKLIKKIRENFKGIQEELGLKSLDSLN